jgi:hypothetical protein
MLTQPVVMLTKEASRSHRWSSTPSGVGEMLRLALHDGLFCAVFNAEKES